MSPVLSINTIFMPSCAFTYSLDELKVTIISGKNAIFTDFSTFSEICLKNQISPQTSPFLKFLHHNMHVIFDSWLKFHGW